MLLATIGHRGERYEFHGDAVAGMCLLTLECQAPEFALMLQGRVPRATVKDTIRAWRDTLLPGTTLVFAYPGGDPWPDATARVVPGREIEGPPVNFGALPPAVAGGIEMTYHTDPLGVVTGMTKRRVGHPAADLLGEDER